MQNGHEDQWGRFNPAFAMFALALAVLVVIATLGQSSKGFGERNGHDRATKRHSSR